MAPRAVVAEVSQDQGIVNSIRRAAAASSITVQPVRDNISVLMGSGGNIVVLPGRDGTILVDAGIDVSREKITHALGDLRAEPPTHVINTHWHFDHTDGNAWLHDGGATIIAHRKTRAHLSVSTRVESWDFTFPPSPQSGLPTVVFETDLTLHLNGSTIQLKPYAPAHTDSDLSVIFTDADVFDTGDTWWNGFFPFIDYSTGGSIDGTIRAAEANIAAVGAHTIVIPGHGAVGDRSQLIEYRDMLIEVRDKVASLKRHGMHLDEILAAKPTEPYDAKWGNFVINGSAFTVLVHAGV